MILKFLFAALISLYSMASKIVYQPAFFKSDAECVDFLTQERLAYFELINQKQNLTDQIKFEIAQTCTIEYLQELPEIVHGRVIKIEEVTSAYTRLTLTVYENFGRISFPEEVSMRWPPSGAITLPPRIGETVIVGFNNPDYKAGKEKTFEGFAIVSARRIATDEDIRKLRLFRDMNHSPERMKEHSQAKVKNSKSSCNPGFYLSSSPSDQLLDVLPTKDCVKELKNNPIKLADKMYNLVPVGFSKGTTVGDLNSILKDCNVSILRSEAGTAIVNLLIHDFKGSADFNKAESCLRKSKKIEYVIPNKINDLSQ